MSVPLGPLPLILALLLAGLAASQGDIIFLALAVGSVVLVALPFAQGTRVGSGFLEVGSLFLTAIRVKVSEIELVEFGVLHERGFPGYSGAASAIQTSSWRQILRSSLFTGRRRLENWGQPIAQDQHFNGILRSNSGVMPGNEFQDGRTVA